MQFHLLSRRRSPWGSRETGEIPFHNDENPGSNEIELAFCLFKMEGRFG